MEEGKRIGDPVICIPRDLTRMKVALFGLADVHSHN